jgi:hypothetical protein
MLITAVQTQKNEKEASIQTASLTRSSTRLLVSEIGNQAEIVRQQAYATLNLTQARVRVSTSLRRD